MLMAPLRLTILSIACLAMMSFKIGAKVDDEERMICDVRSAFVTSRSDIPAELMQRVHHRVSQAIHTATRSRLQPRVILAIRISPIDQKDMLIGHRASSVVDVRATAVASGEVVAQAKFKATALGWNKGAALEKLGEGIAQQIIAEFQLTPEARTSVASALAPAFSR